MPNHQKPIAECDLWDILDWDVVSELASGATRDPRDDGGKNLWPWLANELIEAANQSDNTAAIVFTGRAAKVLGYGEAATRRQKAGIIAEKYGADPVRLIEYLEKRGLF